MPKTTARLVFSLPQFENDERRGTEENGALHRLPSRGVDQPNSPGKCTATQPAPQKINSYRKQQQKQRSDFSHGHEAKHQGSGLSSLRGSVEGFNKEAGTLPPPPRWDGDRNWKPDHPDRPGDKTNQEGRPLRATEAGRRGAADPEHNERFARRDGRLEQPFKGGNNSMRVVSASNGGGVHSHNAERGGRHVGGRGGGRKQWGDESERGRVGMEKTQSEQGLLLSRLTPSRQHGDGNKRGQMWSEGPQQTPSSSRVAGVGPKNDRNKPKNDRSNSKNGRENPRSRRDNPRNDSSDNFANDGLGQQFGDGSGCGARQGLERKNSARNGEGGSTDGSIRGDERRRYDDSWTERKRSLESFDGMDGPHGAPKKVKRDTLE